MVLELLRLLRQIAGQQEAEHSYSQHSEIFSLLSELPAAFRAGPIQNEFFVISN